MPERNMPLRNIPLHPNNSARQTSADGFVYTLRSDGAACVLGYKGGARSVVYPTAVDGHPVGHVSMAAFSMTGIEELIIPEGVEEIAPILMAYELRRIVLPDDLEPGRAPMIFRCRRLEEIRARASSLHYATVGGVLFSRDGTVLYCVPQGLKLTEYTVPAGVREIAGSAFGGCASLRQIQLPAGLRCIGDGAFQDCADLLSADLPDSLEHIGACVWSGCGKLERLHIPAAVRTIGADAFPQADAVPEITVDPENRHFIVREGMLLDRELTRLLRCARQDRTEVQVPEGVEEIDPHAFSGCLSLRRITLPDSLKRIGAGAFAGCTALESAEIPAGVQEIPADAFVRCVSLREVRLPASLKRLQSFSFWGCRSLRRVDVPEGADIDDDAFDNREIEILRV